jgi:hypothetical protein
MASFTTQEAQQLFSQYTSEELQSMLGKAKFTELSSKLKETKPAKQEAPVVQSFSNGGEVNYDFTPLGTIEAYEPSFLEMTGNTIEDFLVDAVGFDRPYSRRVASGIGFSRPEDAPLLRGTDVFGGPLGVGVATADFEADPGILTGLGVPLSAIPFIGGPISRGLGSLVNLFKRQPSVDVQDAPDIVEEGIGALDPVKEAAQLAREEKRQKKIARQEAAAFVPEEAKISAGQSTVNEEIIKNLGTDLETRPFLTEMIDNTNDMKYSFKTGRLIFNPDSGLGMSQAGKPRNSKSVLKSFDRLGVTKNELRQTGMLDLLTKNEKVTLQDLQDTYNMSKPDFKMVRTVDAPAGDTFEHYQRMTHNPAQNYNASDEVGYEVVDVMSHAHYDEGQPFINNILLKDPHYEEVDVGYRTATNPTARVVAEDAVDKIPIPNSMFHTRGSTVLFNEGTDLQAKFPKGAQIIEEIQDDHLGQVNLVKEAKDPSTLPRLQTNFNRLQTRINTDASELSKIIRDDNLMFEVATLMQRRYPEMVGGIDFDDVSTVPDQMRALFHASSNNFYVTEAGMNPREVRERVERLGGRTIGDNPIVPKAAFGENIAEELNSEFIRDFRQVLIDANYTSSVGDQMSTPLRNFNTDKLVDVVDGLQDLGYQRKRMNKFDALSEINITNPDLTRKLEVELPKFNARKKELENAQYKAEMELDSFNRVTEEAIEGYTQRIDTVNDLIKKIEGDLPDETYRHLRESDDKLITVSRERMLDIQAKKRDELQKQLIETERRSYADNPERTKRETALNKANDALRENREEFISKNPEMSEFLEMRDVDEITGALRLETLAPDSVFEDQTTTALYMLKQELALAQKKGLSGIIMPDYRNIARARGAEGEVADATFKRTYEVAPEKLVKELEELGFEVGKVDVNYGKFESTYGGEMETFPSRYIKIPENMPDFEPEVKLAKGGLVRKQVV